MDAVAIKPIAPMAYQGVDRRAVDCFIDNHRSNNARCGMQGVGGIISTNAAEKTAEIYNFFVINFFLAATRPLIAVRLLNRVVAYEMPNFLSRQ
jgi:hypothetical protein